jgi:hypothetical protein
MSFNLIDWQNYDLIDWQKVSYLDTIDYFTKTEYLIDVKQHLRLQKPKFPPFWNVIVAIATAVA